MKIVQINSTYNQGSTGKLTKDIHTQLIKLGHKSFVFYGRGNSNTEPNIFKITNKVGFIVDVIFTRLFNRHSETNKLNTMKLIKEVEKIKPDIIHLHNIHGYYLNYKMLFKYLNKVETPVVWLLHDQWAISGGAAHFDIDKFSWKQPEIDESKRLSKTYPKYLFINTKSIKRNYKNKKKLFNISNLTIVTPSKWLKEICEKSFFKDTNIHVINNGVDLNIFKPMQKKNRPDKIILLGVANIWTPTKGLQYFEKLSQDLDPNKYQIILVGLNKKQLNNLPSSIVGYERTETIEELVCLYSQADVFINPTLEDNFPTVNIEAQACGTPVITFDTGGSGENVCKLEGKVIEKGNYSQLLDAILKIKKKNNKISKTVSEFSKKYSKEKMVCSYIELYKKITKEL